MKLILHIGTEKTGTTLLQDWLYSNQRELSAHGVFLSNVLEKTNNRKLVSYFIDGLDDWAAAKGITGLDQKEAYFAGFVPQFTEEIRNAGNSHHTMIITSEHFHSRLRGPKAIQRLANFLRKQFSEVIVICYFREQSQMATSLYSTGMRVSTTQSLDEFMASVTPADYYYNFFQIAQNWSNAFGVEHCNFRLYNRKDFRGGDLRLDFMSAAGLDHHGWNLSFDQKSSNESLSLVEAALFRVVNQEIPFWNKEGGGINHANPRVKAAIASCAVVKNGSITYSRSGEIFQRFKDSNQQFFAAFLDGRQGFAEPQTIESEEETRIWSASSLASDLEELVRKILRARLG